MGVPRTVISAVRRMKDGREICSKSAAGRREYASRLEDMWDRDRGICCLCGQFVPLEEATFEHKKGRGLGGSKRDDRIGGNGIAHWYGNNAKGSMDYGKYLEFSLRDRIANCRGMS